MPKYIINKTSHEVHLENGCGNQPEGNNQQTITGNPKTLAEAVQEAKKMGFSNANKCGHCDKNQ